jgi:hypothetical protein
MTSRAPQRPGGKTMSDSGNNPSDKPKILAMSYHALSRPACTCGCACCASDAPFGRPEDGPSKKAVEERMRYVERLIPKAKALLVVAREALDAGATTAAEIRDMQQLEIWFGRLLAEQALEGQEPKKTK